MSFEPETSICPSCHRQGCSSPQETVEDGVRYTDWICKCGCNVNGESEIIDTYDCPIHGTGEGGDCPRC